MSQSTRAHRLNRLAGFAPEREISEATIEKVNAAINTLGYVHKRAAATCANTSNLIGLILRDFSDSFSIKVMASIVQDLEKQGYMVFRPAPERP
jgi:LacI family transcriptional regulator of maltose regulon